MCWRGVDWIIGDSIGSAIKIIGLGFIRKMDDGVIRSDVVYE